MKSVKLNRENYHGCLMNSYLLQIKLFLIKVDMEDSMVQPVMILEGKRSVELVEFF